jgi:hypothetical protein
MPFFVGAHGMRPTQVPSWCKKFGRTNEKRANAVRPYIETGLVGNEELVA